MTKARLYWLVATGLIAASALVAWAHGFNFNERGLGRHVRESSLSCSSSRCRFARGCGTALRGVRR